MSAAVVHPFCVLVDLCWSLTEHAMFLFQEIEMRFKQETCLDVFNPTMISVKCVIMSRHVL